MYKWHSIAIIVCSVISTVSTSGCAQYKWQKYGASKIDFNRDIYECQTEAARTYPTQVIAEQITPAYTTPTTTNCYGTRAADGSSGYSNVNCKTTPGQRVPGVARALDLNASNRSQATEQCMYARGWQLVQVSSSQSSESQVEEPLSQPMDCASNSDCTSVTSCRSMKGGGTECRPN